MNYGEIRTLFLGILNRDDCTNDLADKFLKQGIARIHRVLRVPAMEAVAFLDTDTNGYTAIPPGYLQMKDGLVFNSPTPRKLERKEWGWLMQQADAGGCPRYYARSGTNWLIKPNPGETVQALSLSYYSEMPAVEAPTDTNVLMTIASDLFCYAGLKYAADYYLDDRSVSFEETIQGIFSELKLQASEQEMSEGYVYVGPGTDCEY